MPQHFEVFGIRQSVSQSFSQSVWHTRVKAFCFNDAKSVGLQRVSLCWPHHFLPFLIDFTSRRVLRAVVDYLQERQVHSCSITTRDLYHNCQLCNKKCAELIKPKV